MTTTTLPPRTTLDHVSTLGRGAEARPTAYRPIPFHRIVAIELRKMFDTRAGVWLLASIGILSVVASAAVVAFAPDSSITFSSFGSAVGVPMSILLPVIAILSVTSEWSQRTGLTTFTLIPARGRVVAAKLVGAVGVGIASMFVALGVGAVGNVVGSAIAGVDTTWDITTAQFAFIVLANVLGLLMGFTIGILVRSSAGAVVGYFVYAFVLSTITSVLAASQEWFRDLQRWVDFQYNQTSLFDTSTMHADDLGYLGLTALIWLVLPLAVGLWQMRRSEVK